jgi:eukaryotic-like serine/threonine-protein kinase
LEEKVLERTEKLIERTKQLAEKNRDLDNKNQELAQKNEELIDSHQRANRIFSALAEALPGTVLDGKYKLEAFITANEKAAAEDFLKSPISNI